MGHGARMGSLNWYENNIEFIEIENWTQLNKLGSQSAKAGNIINKIKRKTSAAKNGAMPANIVDNSTSLSIDFRIKAFMPMGGVTRLISTAITKKIPNQIRSMPIASTIGTNIGTNQFIRKKTIN